ncbi:MAG: ABC transporter ATP-binding protein [Chloroflexi bacterium]|nr:ABC transporter ATP-binding protein [Chloroflexota bacterium]
MQLTIRSLAHTFPGKPPRPALASIDLEIPPGQFVAIIGPSGCGKTTLLRLIANLLHPTQGTIQWNGHVVAPSANLHNGHDAIAWMAQSPALLPWLTVRQNVALAGRFQPIRLTPDEALQKVGLAEHAGVYPMTLSGGMQQRLALARTLSLQASLWLMDEPFASLDELTRERLTQELLELWQPLRPSVLWVTHNIHESLRLADRVLVMSPCPGRLVADLPVDLPRPRQEDHPQFQALLRSLRAALHQAPALERP